MGDRPLPVSADTVIDARSALWDEPNIPDAAFINVQDEPYGARGDGSTDDTGALLAAVSQPDSVVILPPDSVYIVSDTLTLGNGTHLHGPGATIKLSETPTGTLASNGLVLSLGDDCTVDGVTFEHPTSFAGYSCDAYSAAVYIGGKSRCRVVRNTFDLTGCTEGLDGIKAVGVDGTSATAADNFIADNVCIDCAIQWGVRDTQRTIARGNVVSGAPWEALYAWSYAGDACAGCIVEGNTVSNTGRGGIVDWGGYSTDTIIRGNVITNSGVTDTLDGYGISATGYRSIVESNQIDGFEAVGIEVMMDGLISGNHVTQDAGRLGTDIGIIVNPLVAASAKVSGNFVTGTSEGIRVYTNSKSVVIDGNMVSDYASRGVWVLMNTADLTAVTLTGNSFRCSTPPADYRTAVQVENADSGTLLFTATGNIFVWEAGCDGGTNGDRGIVTFESNVTAIGNMFDGGGVTSPAVVKGIFGVSGSNCKYIANSLTGGATVDTSGLTDPVVESTP